MELRVRARLWGEERRREGSCPARRNEVALAIETHLALSDSGFEQRERGGGGGGGRGGGQGYAGGVAGPKLGGERLRVVLGEREGVEEREIHGA